MRREILFALQLSRPGFWLTSIFFYCWPVSGIDVLDSPRFWLGLFFVSFPMGYMIYGWNDAVDYATDHVNPRKGSWLFGAKGTPDDLARLPRRIVLLELPFAIVFVWLIGWHVLWLGVAGIVVAGVYNFVLKGRPPFEVLNQFGYVLVLFFSSMLNEVPFLSWQAVVLGGVFAMHAHIFGEVMDIEPDGAAGRTTTAVVVGPVGAKWIVVAMLFAEAAFCWHYFRDPIFTAFLALGAAWFAIDGTLLWRDRPYTLAQMRAFMMLWNLSAIGLLIHVWTNSTFVA